MTREPGRLAELERLIEALDEPHRVLMRAALVAQRQGKLDESARVAARRVPLHPGNAWIALLLALEAAELALAGAVQIKTPASRFRTPETSTAAPGERWGVFSATIWPSGTIVSLNLNHASSTWALEAEPLSSLTLVTVTTIAKTIGAHFGRTVSVVTMRKKQG